MNNQMRTRKISRVIFFVIITALLFCATACNKIVSETEQSAVKAVTLDVVRADKTSDHYDATTQQEFLKGVLDELAETADFSYEETGGMIITVNGERADFNKDKAYWAIFVNE